MFQWIRINICCCFPKNQNKTKSKNKKDKKKDKKR